MDISLAKQIIENCSKFGVTQEEKNRKAFKFIKIRNKFIEEKVIACWVFNYLIFSFFQVKYGVCIHC